MGMSGQSSDPTLPSYHTNGLPLITNLIELVTQASVASGRHQGLKPGKIALLAWPGQPDNPATTYQGVKWLHADSWMTYQRTNFVTPGFPGYPSGHSTFSRSAAELLTAITGSEFFPGGLGSYTITSLANEKGPTQPVTLQWATYYDAADQVGLSRIWGGIHPPVDDFTGRRLGAQCGEAVWALAQKYFDGSVLNMPVSLAFHEMSPGVHEVRFNTVRGLYYKLQWTASLDAPFMEGPLGSIRALENWISATNSDSTPSKFYRVSVSLTP
jgi:hypothetical protein